MRHVRLVVLVLALVLLASTYSCARTKGAAAVTATSIAAPASANAPQPKVDFNTQIKPIVARCQPCHFSGGKVYDKLPFDRPETIKRLGTKLFTRIHDENERRLIRDFLAQ
jgi:cytochrome c553